MKNVLIADSHPIVIKGLASILKKDEAYKIVAKSNDENELKNHISLKSPDIIIMDIDMPNSSGLSIIKTLKQNNPEVRIIIFSHQPEELYALSAIRFGASGYINKSKSLKKIKTAIDQVARGGIYLSKVISEKISSKSSSKTGVVSKYRALSSREIEVLNFISKGLKNKDIAEMLKINEKTVSTYKTRLQKKLNVDSVAGLIKQSKMLELS
ncbi:MULTISPECIES: response regulator [Croceibacter]|uniref:response regulator n=1 Tax=Croceibacter TaxID=216431 RepID=UPI000C649B73|nr:MULTISPECIES: response regulator transcription factor [Croceibacter]MBG26738.1 DNA-binding response regulator [Croceibacter sp.]|tara:strand:- start:8263 stop:8895 length:633 start_codon:yes stop_codon:yes gene_type:complete